MENTNLVKSSDGQELKQATFIVMVPDEIDLHGDITSEDEVRKACFNFNKYCRQPNLLHMAQTTSFEFVESYIAPTDLQIDGIEVKKGTWLATVQVHDDGLWDLIKQGEINGLSIGADAKIKDIDD